MAIPYKCLVARNSATASGGSDWVLFGASGSRIVVQASKGAASTWPEQDASNRDDENEETQERPGKRIKLEQPKEQKSNFSNLILSNNGQYLIGITGEDKCIRVFEIDSRNRLHQLSERCMSRRPSSITITSDDTTILCADKFGDVYALPLLPSPDDDQVEQSATPAPEQPEQKLPSATALTVHSGRNRKTLEEQLKQKAKGPAKSKEPMRFKHDLLLGHVSMLTDVVYARVDDRSYIITADRDEHIRISRGQPQAHVIEGFCFGHEAFVSRLCLTRSGLLVSGGGDDHLFIWDWQNHRLYGKMAIKDVAEPFVLASAGLGLEEADNAGFKVAVSGIWNIPSSGDTEEVVVVCEGVPALFRFTIEAGHTTGEFLPLRGNALDVTFIQNATTSPTMVVSIDNIHMPGSTTAVRDDVVSRLQFFSQQQDFMLQVGDAERYFAGEWREDKSMEGILDNDPDERLKDQVDEKAVRDMLYNVENLRKRPGAED